MSLWSTQALLLLLILGISVFWYVSFLWGRRKLYIYSRKVPGPFSPPIIGSAYLFMADLSPSGILNVLVNIQKTYPGLCKFWFGPRLIYFLVEPKHIEKVLTNKNALNKNYFYDFITKAIGTGLLTAPVTKWKKHRNLIMHSFSQRYLNSYVAVFSKQATIFNNQLSRYVGSKNIDTFSLFSRLTLDITFENMAAFPASTQITNSALPKIIERLLEIIVTRGFNILIHLDIMFELSSLSKEFHELVNKLRNLTGTMIEAKKKQLEYNNVFVMGQLVEETGEKEEMKSFVDRAIERSYFTDEDLKDEVDIMIAAANDTTAGSLTFLFEILGLYQDVQQKVYEEVVEVLGKDREVEALDLPKLKYTERVILENLRLFPIGSIYFRKIEGDIDLGEAVLPEGCSVCVCPFYIHRNPKLWPDPLKFDPSRFLPDQVAKRHPCAYVPFSYGPRNCIGYRYAILSMKTIVATVIRRYKFDTEYETLEDMEVKLSLLLHLKEGSKLSVSFRKNV